MVEKMWEILKRDFGIQTMEELESALEWNSGIDISVFTQDKEERKNYDTARVS